MIAQIDCLSEGKLCIQTLFDYFFAINHNKIKGKI